MNFNGVAPVYDLLARLVFGRSLIRAQRWGIARVRSGSAVLVLGGGTGVTLPDLLARQPAHILYVDASVAMVNRARQRTPPLAPVRFSVGTESELTASEQFDYIVLPFILDLYPADVLRDQLIPTLLRHLEPGGQLIVTDFAELKTDWQRTCMWLMLRFFGLVAAVPVQKWTNWPEALRQVGLTEQEGCFFRGGQVRSGCWVRRA